VMKNYHKFDEKGNYYFESIKRPYFCNSLFFIKTEEWKKIISDRSLFRDGYDEVPLNLYKDNHDLNMCFARNGFCIHMAYNTIGPNKQKLVQDYYTKELNKIIEENGL
jgi:hypothetical protein